MAKSFTNIKKSLGLLDVIQFGKYKGCRVDSLIDHDDDYLRYMQTQGIKFDKSVMDALTNKFSATSIAVNKADDESYEEFDRYVPEDIPF
jgi:uncharacterized protein (DUF3820 family)